jgi:hypothetical protein
MRNYHVSELLSLNVRDARTKKSIKEYMYVNVIYY